MVSIVSASVCGATHKHKGQECQDAYKIAGFGEITILAAADGHGSESCPHSKVGAELAVGVFARLMKRYFAVYSREPDTLRAFLEREGSNAVAKAIEREWKREVTKRAKKLERGRSSTLAYGTTLLGLVLTPTFYYAFQLGDGNLLCISGGEARDVLDSPRILGVQTYSLSQDNAFERALSRVGEVGEGAAYLLSTDGFANSYPDESAFRRTCCEYVAAIGEHGAAAVQANLSEWLEETSRGGSGDDVTVVIAKL